MHITLELSAWTRPWLKNRGSSKCLFLYSLRGGVCRMEQHFMLQWSRGMKKSRSREEERDRDMGPRPATSRSQWNHGPTVVHPVTHPKAMCSTRPGFPEVQRFSGAGSSQRHPVPEPNRSCCVMTMAHHGREGSDSPSAHCAVKGWCLFCTCS